MEKALLYILTSAMMIFLWSFILVMSPFIPSTIVLLGGILIGTWIGFMVFNLLTIDREWKIEKYEAAIKQIKELSDQMIAKPPVDLAKAASADASHQDKVTESKEEVTVEPEVPAEVVPVEAEVTPQE